MLKSAASCSHAKYAREGYWGELLIQSRSCALLRLLGFCRRGSITCKQTLTMRANREIEPYAVEKEKVMHRIFLQEFQADLLLQVQALLATTEASGSRFSWQNNEAVRQLVDARDAAVTFDETNFAEADEKQLLESKAHKLTPLVNSSGRVVATGARIYFQSFFNVKSKEAMDVASWPMTGAAGIKKVERRRYQV